MLIFAELLAELHALRADQGFPEAGPVLRGKQGKPLQLSTLQRWVKSWLTRSDVNERYTLHSLRRFAAKNWLNVGSTSVRCSFSSATRAWRPRSCT